tara:strand:+ start:329 stop:487 length:159 start_codon:yes stop_codon:yes gene_type:complete
MKPWMIEQTKRERDKERPQIPLTLPLAEASPTGSATQEEGDSRGYTEIDYRV